jgi:signal transduction histidine kinase
VHVFLQGEIAPALLQLAVTLGLAALFFYLHRRYRKRHFLWWSVAWGIYSLRLVCIIVFLASNQWTWLYWHQVATGWTAFAFLWAALVFSRQERWRSAYLLFLLFPPFWSWVTIFRLDDFGLAAGTTVAFLSAATIWTGVVFERYRRRTGSTAAGILAITLLLWGLHHLDYPILRARGAWNPWGYYLDLLFVLAMGGAVLLLVVEEQRQGLLTLSALSGDLRRPQAGDSIELLLRRPLALRGIQGAALVKATEAGVVAVRAVGACGEWTEGVPDPIAGLVRGALAGAQPLLESERRHAPGVPAFTAILPLHAAGSDALAFVAVGEIAAPFAALDDRILVTVGEQIGAALDNAELDQALKRRTEDLERLSLRISEQHEAQRRRLARELHDETAQVFAGLKLQLGSLREAAPAEFGDRFNRLLELVSAGTRSIRSVAEDLRPALLDDLGLVPAVRALVSDFRDWSGIEVSLEVPQALPPLDAESELALFRAAQEALSNVARHAEAARVRVRVVPHDAGVLLVVEDDGRGLPDEELSRIASGPGRSGLFGLRERIVGVGGTVELSTAVPHGLRIAVSLPGEADG